MTVLASPAASWPPAAPRCWCGPALTCSARRTPRWGASSSPSSPLCLRWLSGAGAGLVVQGLAPLLWCGGPRFTVQLDACPKRTARLPSPCSRRRPPPRPPYTYHHHPPTLVPPRSLALLGFVVMHGRLCAQNKTTIEAYEKQPIRQERVHVSAWWQANSSAALRNTHSLRAHGCRPQRLPRL